MSLTTPPPGATGVITVDLAALRGNWQSLSRLVAPAECAAVVKADAYGLGANRVIPALKAAGCRTFFVATADEARQARLLAPSAVIYVLDGLLPGAAPALADMGVRPALSTLEDVREWAALARSRGRRLPAALHIDSGLNRLGLSDDEIKALATNSELARAIEVTLVMSHLACADEPDQALNAEQLAAFNRRRAILPDAPASLAASDGLMLGKPFHFSLVRPGYALYGGQAFQGGQTPVKPVVSVKVRVLQVHDVRPGDTVGYSATWKAVEPSRIATIAAGYADGIPRQLSAGSTDRGGEASIGGQVFPIVGRVSMDLITIDISGAVAEVRRGDWAELIGPNLPIERVAQRAGTIGYEILTRLGRRFHRDYVEGVE